MSSDWLDRAKDQPPPWTSLPLNVLPNILGFSMGGMAITLAFSGSTLFRVITEGGKSQSYFIRMVAAFYHFILSQVLAIFAALFCRVYQWWLFSFFGYLLMTYAILIALATAGQLFNIARVANEAADLNEEEVSGAEHANVIVEGEGTQNSP
jgi:hypothetical protein